MSGQEKTIGFPMKICVSQNKVEQDNITNNMIDWTEEDILRDIKLEVQESLSRQEIREDDKVSQDARRVNPFEVDVSESGPGNTWDLEEPVENNLKLVNISVIPNILEVNIKEESHRASPIEELERHVYKSILEQRESSASQRDEYDNSNRYYINNIKQKGTRSPLRREDMFDDYLSCGRQKRLYVMQSSDSNLDKEIHSEIQSSLAPGIPKIPSVHGELTQNGKGAAKQKRTKRDTGTVKELPKPPHFICSICKHVSKKAKNLKRHSLVHKTTEETVMYSCTKCSYKTKYKENLTHHMLCHKVPDEVTMYKCDTCLYETKRKKNLRDHMLLHKSPSDVIMFQCDVCSFVAKRKQNLKDHMNSHKRPSELPMYRCDRCSFETKHRTSLKHHKLGHQTPSEIATFQCDVCSFTTRYKSNVKVHMLSHRNSSDVPMYKCNICSYQSKFKRYVSKHMTTKGHSAS